MKFFCVLEVLRYTRRRQSSLLEGSVSRSFRVVLPMFPRSLLSWLKLTRNQKKYARHCVAGKAKQSGATDNH